VSAPEIVLEAPQRSAVSFSEWLEGRRPLHLSTNSGSDEIAFQGWRNFKEAFAPELIGQAVEETEKALGRAVTNCIDPFGGSGTTSLACQFLGVSPTTIEVNPYLADLIEAKLANYDVEQLIRDFKAVVEGPITEAYEEAFPGAPQTFVEPGIAGRYLFSSEIAARLASLRDRIAAVTNETNRRLMRVMLGAVALPVSNVVVSGKGRRYRRGWADRTIEASRVQQLFEDAVVRAIYEIRRYEQRKDKRYNLLRGDARKLIPINEPFDIAVFSPPYPNSFDYTDVYNVELWVCGYLKTNGDNKNLRLSTLRSHVQIARDFDAPELGSETLARVSAELIGVRGDLWNRHIPDMVSAYFADMCVVIERLANVLTTGGRAYMVVGDSRYAGIQVPVATILNELALTRGFTIAGEEPFRSMRASPQQGGRPELMETLLTLSRR
jgi:DNA modification methylase